MIPRRAHSSLECNLGAGQKEGVYHAWTAGEIVKLQKMDAEQYRLGHKVQLKRATVLKLDTQVEKAYCKYE